MSAAVVRKDATACGLFTSLISVLSMTVKASEMCPCWLRSDAAMIGKRRFEGEIFRPSRAVAIAAVVSLRFNW